MHKQMEILQAMGSAYAKRQRSPRRLALIIIAAILLNLLIIAVFLNVFGYSTAHPLPWLIKVHLIPGPNMHLTAPKS